MADEAKAARRRGPLSARRALPLLAVFVLGATPMLLDGATVETRFAIVVLAALCALATAVSERTLDAGEGATTPLALGAAFVGIGALQLVPLAHGLASTLLSPLRVALPERVATVTGLPSPLTVSMDRGAGLAALALDAAVVMAIFVGARARRGAGTSRVLAALALGSALTLAAGLAHGFAEAERVFGLYRPQHASTAMGGPLMNGNHFAGLATLTFPFALAALVRAKRESARAACALGMLVSVVAAFASLSRAGIVVFLAVAVASTFVAWTGRARMPSVPARSLAPAIGFSVAAVALLVALEGETLLREFREAPYKVPLLTAGARFAASSGLAGYGRGAFGVAFAEATTETHRPTFAENVLSQTVGELGLVAGPALLLLCAWFVVRRLRPSCSTSERLAALALVGLGLHDLADYALEMPGLRLAAATAFGALAPHGLPRDARGRARGALLVFAFVAAFVATPLAVRLDASRGIAQLRAALERGETERGLALGRALAANHPFDPVSLAMATEACSASDASCTLPLSNATRRRAPSLSAPHESAYRYLARAGRASQAIAELRQVARKAPTRVALTYCSHPVATSAFAMARVVPADERGLRVLRELDRCLPATMRRDVARAAHEQNPRSVALALEYLRLEHATAGAERAAALHHAMRGFEGSAEFVLEGARLDLARGDAGAALAALDAMRPAARAAAHAELEALAAAHAGDGARTRRALARYESATDDLVSFHALAGRCLARLGDHTTAVSHFVLAYEARPSATLLDAIDASARAAGLVGRRRWVYEKRCELGSCPPEVSP